MDAETCRYIIYGFTVIFFIQVVVSLIMQRKVTRLESKLRAIRFEAEEALALIGPLSADDAPALEMLSALGTHAGEDAAGQLFDEEK
jgi:hypothetical protein